jgi:membrane fusion protein, multidrug efflux system
MNHKDEVNSPPISPQSEGGDRAGGKASGKEPITARIGSERHMLASRDARWMLLVFLIFLAVAGVVVWRHYATHQSTDDAQIDGNIYPVSARVSGHVIAVEVDNNQFVKKGQVLVRLDPTDYQVALERAQAAEANAMARAEASQTGVPITSVGSSSQISSAEAGVELASASVAGAAKEYQASEAKVKQAQADYDKAESDVARYAQLVKKDEISQQQYEHSLQTAQADAAAVAAAQAAALAAEQNVAAARGRLAQAQAELRSSKTGPQRVKVSRAEAASAQAAAKEAKANLDQAKLDLDYTTIRAPMDGIVGKKSVETGQNISASQALMAIVPIEDLYVTANFKEAQLKNMRPGDPATIHVDAYDRNYKGHVLDIAGATGERFSLLPPENATGNYVKVVQRIPVKILFDKGEDPDHLLRIGMSVEPTVITK